MGGRERASEGERERERELRNLFTIDTRWKVYGFRAFETLHPRLLLRELKSAKTFADAMCDIG